MTPHQTIAVAVRLFAIWLALYVLLWLPGFIQQTKATDDQASIIIYVAFVLLGLFVLLLWFLPRTIAHRLLAPSEQRTETKTSSNDYFSSGCNLLGLWTLTQSLPGLARYVLLMIFSLRENPDLTVSTSDLHASGLYFALQTFLGILLVFGARTIIRFVTRVRYED